MPEQKKAKLRHWQVMLIAAVCGAVLFLPFLLLIFHMLPIGDFDSYAPPALPLTSVSGAEDLTAERDVTMDFTSLAFDCIYPERTRVTDRYLVTNPTGETVTTQLAFPLFWDPYDHTFAIPTVTVEGGAVETSLYASLDAAQSVERADHFGELQEALAQTDFLAEALSSAPALDTPVTVYHISNFTWPDSEDPQALRIGVIYSRNENTTVWKYGTMDMTENEELGIDYMLLHVPTDDTPWIMNEAYLIVEGPDVVNLAIQGYRGYEVTESAMVDGVRADVEEYQSTLGEMVALLAQDYTQYTPYDRIGMRERLPAQLLYEGAARRIASDLYSNQAIDVLHSLSELFASVESERRLMYQIFSVTIPAGETITVQTQYILPGSVDFYGFAGVTSDRTGFELATTLGSNLRFTGLSATLEGEDAILDFRNQNFGFDPENGITEVTLDPETERYYLTIGLP